MEDFRTALKATSYAGYDGASEIDLTDPESIRDDYFALDLHQPHCEEPMQGAAELMGTHADSIELVEDVRGKFALYRCLYNGTEVHQEELEQYLFDTYGVECELYGKFVLVENA